MFGCTLPIYFFFCSLQLVIQLSIELDEVYSYMDIIDKGPGVASGHIAHLFEPFFTTKEYGIGLGLYLAKELANINGIHLGYIPLRRQQQGGRFRLMFLNAH